MRQRVNGILTAEKFEDENQDMGQIWERSSAFGVWWLSCRDLATIIKL